MKNCICGHTKDWHSDDVGECNAHACDCRTMTETNGIYPLLTPSQRHKDKCNGCLEPQFCDCLCKTCKTSREKWFSSEEYRKYLSHTLDPRD